MSSIAPAAKFAASSRNPQAGSSKVRQQLEGRLHAAQVNGGAAAAEPRGNGRYTVTGRNGSRYTCQVVSLDVILCDCKAGMYHGPSSCWHAASTWLRVIADRAATSTTEAA